MSSHHNPRIVTDGLVFAYDMNNAVKSWKGKPTENLVPDPLFTQQNWSTWSGRGADSWSYDTFSGETTVYTDLSINTGERHQLYKDITVSSSLTTFALSIDVYVLQIVMQTVFLPIKSIHLEIIMDLLVTI